jgi:acyl-coenzyme A thioesterase PaaI-like protein
MTPDGAADPADGRPAPQPGAATAQHERKAGRRATVDELGSAVRRLVQATVDTEVDERTLAAAAELAGRAADLLEQVTRSANQLASVDEGHVGYRTYSAVNGRGNPVSPPITFVRTDAAQGEVEAHGALHRVHEGPPTYGHGGMSAMIMDQVLGTVIALTGRMGLTRTLEMRYHRPVPLGEQLRFVGRVTAHDATRIEAQGEITTVAAPEVVLVRAAGVFLVPRPDQVARLFGHVESAPDAIPSGD